MHSRSAYTPLPMPLVEGDGKQDVRSLRSAIGNEWFIRCPLKVRIVPVNIRVAVTRGCEVNNASPGSHQGHNPVDQNKVPQVIGTELSFKAVRSVSEGCSHHARVSDNQIERFALGYELVGTGTHALQIGEIELDKFEASAVFLRIPPDLSG